MAPSRRETVAVMEPWDTASDLGERPVAVGLREAAHCLVCAKGLPKRLPHICPECIVIAQPVFFPRGDWVADHAD
jgi:hypothetical protein